MQTIGSVMTTLSVKVMIDKATTDDDQPTPGYLYKDITELTFASAAQCQALQDSLIQKLQKDSFNVRLKALRIVKHCLQSGHYSFRRDLQRRTEYLRDCINFRGPPDPFRGDAPYKLVREEAQLILNALFQGEDNKTESSNRPAAMSSASNNSISSGSDNYQSSSIFSTTTNTTPTAPGKKYMQGFGNTPSAPSKPQGGFFENVVNKVSELTTDLGQTLSGSSGHTNHHMGGYGSAYNTGSLPGTRDYGNSSFQSSSGNVEHHRGVPGGGWGSDSSPFSSASSFSASPPAPPTRAIKSETKFEGDSSPQAITGSISVSSLTQSDGVIEKKVIEEITSGSGVRVVPPKEVISQFCSRCSSLDSRIIVKLLVSKLTANSAWQTHLKALCALEGLLQGADRTKYERELKNEENGAQVRSLLDSVQKAVADRAVSVLNLAGLIEHNGDQGCQFESEEIKSEPTKRKGKANSKKTAVDAVSQTTSISTLPSSQNNIIDLFDGLSVGSSANNHTSDQSLSLLLPAEKPSPTQKPNEALVDIFATTTEPTPVKSGSEIDFLAELSTFSTSEQSKTATSSFKLPASPVVTSSLPLGATNSPLLPPQRLGTPVVYYPPVAPLIAVRPTYSSLSDPIAKSTNDTNTASKTTVNSGFDFVQDELKRHKS